MNLESSQALAARVKRYHTYPVLYQQSVGEHEHRVATLYVELWGLPPADVLWYLLNHDSGELYSGDTPFHAKRKYPKLKDVLNKAEEEGRSILGIELPPLTENEFIKFKIADILEMMEFGLIEVAMGNKLAQRIIDKTQEAIAKLTKDNFSDYYTVALSWILKKEKEWKIINTSTQ